MYETEEQIEAMQSLLDRSFESAGPHLLAISTPGKAQAELRSFIST